MVDDRPTGLDHDARISGNYEDAEARAVSGDSYHATRCKSQVTTHFGPTLLYVPPFYVIPLRPSSLPVFSFVLPLIRFQTRSAGANYFSRSQSRCRHHSSTLTTISGFIYLDSYHNPLRDQPRSVRNLPTLRIIRTQLEAAVPVTPLRTSVRFTLITHHQLC